LAEVDEIRGYQKINLPLLRRATGAPLADVSSWRREPRLCMANAKIGQHLLRGSRSCYERPVRDLTVLFLHLLP